MKHTIQAGGIATLLAVICGCSTVASFTAEKSGQVRRATLAKCVDQTCAAQQKLKEDLQSAWGQYASLEKFAAGNQRKQSDKMSTILARCKARSKDVEACIAKVDCAGQNLFREWKAASEKHPNEMYRRDRGAKRLNAHRDYNRMMGFMRNAESKTGATLSLFRNLVDSVQAVIFDPSFGLANNLNADAKTSIQQESERLSAQVDFLIQNLSDSIDEANLFIEKIQD